MDKFNAFMDWAWNETVILGPLLLNLIALAVTAAVGVPLWFIFGLI